MGEAHSPAVLQKIIQAAVRNRSYREADQELSESAELTIGPKAVERVVRRIAAAAQCSAEVESDRGPVDEAPGAAEPPSVDECRSRYWRDSKVGCLLSMHSEKSTEDPCPEIPASFLNISRVTQLVRELGSHGSGVPPAPAEEKAEPGQDQTSDPQRPAAPVPLVRTVLASRACSAAFGAMLVAAAWARGFAAAARKAFVADGAAMNWTMWELYFSHYVPILDFIHALQYVFAAAMAGRCFAAGWDVYARWIQLVWEGRVAAVIAELRQRQEDLGLPPKDASASDPRKIVAVTLGYLETHQSRMDYARYRRLGLPIMSCYRPSSTGSLPRLWVTP